jgi:2-C-methyl-D-erythritol 2,4-cyclodiphosphate synthase
MIRTGLGFDVHRLAAGRKLILGGVEIPFDKGLLGHSDADVLVHAICDALLGAAGLGDIGEHFPDTDPALKDISSLNLLGKTCDLVRAGKFCINNLDATLFAQAPRLTPFKLTIKESLSRVMEIAPDRINIKATTTEGLDAVGKGEGMAAMCVATLEKST